MLYLLLSHSYGLRSIVSLRACRSRRSWYRQSTWPAETSASRAWPRYAHDDLQPVKQRLRNMLSTDPRIVQVEKAYEEIVKRWVSKMERLGLVVKGLWLVDFDTGDGYLCWKYPELKINHYHDYESGFAGRRSLDEIIEEMDPDWV